MRCRVRFSSVFSPLFIRKIEEKMKILSGIELVFEAGISLIKKSWTEFCVCLSTNVAQSWISRFFFLKLVIFIFICGGFFLPPVAEHLSKLSAPARARPLSDEHSSDCVLFCSRLRSESVARGVNTENRAEPSSWRVIDKQNFWDFNSREFETEHRAKHSSRGSPAE